MAKETKKQATKAKKPAPQRRKAEGGTRDAKGRFVKGVSGNPGGMTKEQATTLAQIKALAAEKSADAVEALHEIAMDGEDERARVQAAVAILDRAFGRPRQELELSGPDGGAMEIDAKVQAEAAVKPDQLADVLAVLSTAGVVVTPPEGDDEA